MKTPTLPAACDTPCSCCLRMHRKLTLIDGYWLGNACLDDYTFYMRESDITSSYWRGYEKKHAKVRRMLAGE